VNVFPQGFLYLRPDGYNPLLTPFPPDFELSPLQIRIGNLQVNQFCQSDACVQEEQHDAQVPKPIHLLDVDGSQQSLDLIIGERLHDFGGCLGCPEKSCGVILCVTLPLHPVEEKLEDACVSSHGSRRERLVCNRPVGIVLPHLYLGLEVNYEGAEMVDGHLRDVSRQTILLQVLFEINESRDVPADGFGSLALRETVEAKPLEKSL